MKNFNCNVFTDLKLKAESFFKLIVPMLYCFMSLGYAFTMTYYFNNKNEFRNPLVEGLSDTIVTVSFLILLVHSFYYPAKSKCASIHKHAISLSLKVAGILLLLELLAFYGDDLYEFILSNHFYAIGAAAGAVFIAIQFRILPFGPSHNIDRGIDSGINGKPSFAKAEISNEREKYATACHEAGHAALHAGIKHSELPDDFKANIRGKGNVLGFVRSYGPNLLDSANSKVWYMYLLLAGHTAEKQFSNDYGFGGTSDYEKWEKVARAYLLHSEKVHYYCKPKTNLEIKHNSRLLHNLKALQQAKLNKFFRENKAQMKCLIGDLYEKKELNKNQLTEHLQSFTGSSVFPKPKV